MKSAEQLSSITAPLIRVPPPGPKSAELLKKQDQYETESRTYTKQFRIAIKRAVGSTVEDVDGNVFVDWFSGICVLNLGHGNPIVKKAMIDQIEKLVHINEVPSETRVAFLETLRSTLPGSLKNMAKVMFTVTGADACEAAIALARFVSKKKTIVAFGGAYHGVAGDIVGATANYHYRDFAGLSQQNVHHLPYPYTYRFPLKIPESDVSKAVVDQLEDLIKDPYAGPGAIGGVIVEPIEGEGGYIVPPDDFLPMLREVTQRHNVPLIVDEIQSGVGRTGRIWASEHANITPDIICISKSIGGGIPGSMIAYRAEYDKGLPPGFHLGTYRGNPVALAAGEAILRHLKTSDLLQRVTSAGSRIKRRFEEFSGEFPEIGEVRGRGFMIATEMVKNRQTKEPGTEIASKVKEGMFSRGVLMHTCGHYSNVLRFMAPLTIEDSLIESGLGIYRESLKAISGTRMPEMSLR
jgi:diaminobutyrate-2-oxoglutarate transaminase